MSRQLALGSLFGVALLGLLAAPLWAQGSEGEDLEAFRRQLGDYVARLQKLPPTTLNAIYDKPGSLADAAERVAALSPEQLRVLSRALKTVPQWEALPDVLAVVKPGPADPGQAAAQTEAFRGQWLQILSQCEQIPPTMVSPTFHVRVKRLHSLLSGLTPEQVSLFQVKMVEALPELSATLQGRGAPGTRVSASCERNCDNSFPDGILCQVQEILCEIGTFPSRIANFANSAVAFIVQGIKDLLGKITSFIPKSPDEVFNLIPQLRQPNWYLDVANSVPNLAPPCPPDGTPFLGGSMGTVEGAAVFKRTIWWPVKQVYDILPDDIFGAAGKIPVAILLYYPVDYLNMCFAEAWQVKDRELLDAHEQFERSKVDVNIASRARQLTLDRALARLHDLPAGLFAADARIAGQLGVLEGKLDALGAGGSDEAAFLQEFRKLNLRLRMENDLLGKEERLALFYLPRAVGGFIEDVREIVVELIQKMDDLDSGHVGHARRHLARGDLYYARGLYRSAYDRYREAYEHLGHSREPGCRHGDGD